MPTQATIAITPGLGQLLDAVSLLNGASQLVVRETMVIADPSNLTQLAGVTAAGALQVDGSATVQPVSGTITANQGTTPWIVAGGGTAGSAAAGVITVQGIASMTPLLVTATFSAPQHVIIDSGTVTAVTSITNPVTVAQATAGNLNATVVGTGTFAVQASITTLGQQVAAASVPVVLTAAQLSTLTPLTTVAVTQSTTPWIVAGGGAAGTAAPGVITVQGIASMTPLLVTATFSAPQHVIVDSGTIAVTQSTSPWVITGNLTNNNAAPSTNNIGALTALANAADPTFTEGDMVTASVNLAGYQRVLLHAETTKVIGTTRTVGNVGGVLDAATGAAVPANALQVGGTDGTNLQALATDTAGNQKSRPAAPTTALWLQAPINVNSLGANVIVAGVSAKTVRVMRIFFINCDATNTVNVTIQDTTPTSFTGPMRFITAGSFNGVSGQGEPLYVSATGKGIQLNTDVAVQLSGTVWYTQS